jgi:hypothetical protein
MTATVTARGPLRDVAILNAGDAGRRELFD